MLETPSLPAVHLRRLSPLDFLERSALIFREKTAVVDGETRRTYPQLLARVRRFAYALRALGVREGERVAVLCPNVSPLLEAHFAVPLAGGVLCALNTRLSAPEIGYIIGHCGASVIVYAAELEPLLAEIDSAPVRLRIAAPEPSAPSVSSSSPPRAAQDAGASAPRNGAGGEHDYEALLAASPPDPIAHELADEDATLSINYTSGTTGRPKGVMYTHRGAYLNALAEIFHANLRPESVYLWTLPMFHCNGWIYPWAVTAAGATHVCLPKVDPAAILKLIEREDVTHFCAAPTVLVGLANHPSAKPFSHPVHVITAGAPPSPTTIGQMEALGATVTHVYGLTETYGPITVCEWKSSEWDRLEPAVRARLKSRQGVGMITVGAGDVRVVDAALNDVPADGETQGEIVMRGNNVMKGYYRDPEATAKAFAGGWFHSGDVAVMHPDGYLEIRDRAKDIIISGGENISTVQVEKVIMQHPAVLECAVVAIPDERWGEVPKAFVTLKPGTSVSPDELIAFCRRDLAGFKIPRAVAFGDLPKTSTGKIQKFVLREREWQGREKRVN